MKRRNFLRGMVAVPAVAAVASTTVAAEEPVKKIKPAPDVKFWEDGDLRIEFWGGPIMHPETFEPMITGRAIYKNDEYRIGTAIDSGLVAKLEDSVSVELLKEEWFKNWRHVYEQV